MAPIYAFWCAPSTCCRLRPPDMAVVFTNMLARIRLVRARARALFAILSLSREAPDRHRVLRHSSGAWCSEGLDSSVPRQMTRFKTCGKEDGRGTDGLAGAANST